MKIVIASHNLHKIREFKQLLKPFIKAFEPVDILSLHQFPDYVAPEENGATFEENATLKAHHAAKSLDCLVLSDDSGLVVPALNGLPGVNSRRYAGLDATDGDNCKKLLSQMHHLTNVQRSAYFECCLVLADPSGIKKIAFGTCHGILLLEERGSQGFGYDCLFIKEGYDRTFAELDESVKTKISHRHKALEKLGLEKILHSIL